MAVLTGVVHVQFGGVGASPSAQDGFQPGLAVYAPSAVEVARGHGLTQMAGLGAPGRQSKPFTWLAEAVAGP